MVRLSAVRRPGAHDLARYFAITSLAEATAYLDHTALGARLRECAGIVLAIGTADREEILGSIDAAKLRSSMTVSHRAAPDDPVFRQVLDHDDRGVADRATDALLA